MSKQAITTFYSHKGGTGKTSTVLNVAAILAREGLKVGIVDLDIEAPSLATLYDIDTEKHDLLQLLAKHASVADVEKHAVEISIAKEVRVLCLPCSGNADLNDQVRWTEASTTAYLRNLFKAMQSSFDLNHLLLDTRSGVSLQAAFSLQLATQAVISCRLDKQNRQGVRGLRTIFRERGISYSIVANAVPINSPKLNAALTLFQKEVRQKPDFIIPYDPLRYFDDSLIVQSGKAENATVHEEYSRLAKKIAKGAT